MANRVTVWIWRARSFLSNAAVDKARKKNPKAKLNTKSFRQRHLSARGGLERLQALIFVQNPAVLDLE